MSNVSLVNGHIDRPKMTDEQIIKACGDVCNDNRFELIKRYTKELLDHTNIETSKQEMEVIDNVLFRFWQMGWLDKLEEYDRQKAEIEKLENIERIATKTIETQSAEIERLQNSIKEADNYFSKGEMGKGLAVIINLVKELVGDEK